MADDRQPDRENTLAYLMRTTTGFERAIMVASIALSAAFIALDVAARSAVIGSGLPGWAKVLLLAQ